MKYPHTVNVYQRNKTLDDMGGEEFSWSLRKSSIKGRLYRKTEIGELKKKDIGETESFDYTFMTNELIYEGERLLKDSVYYEVMQVYKAAGTKAAHHYELKVKQI